MQDPDPKCKHFGILVFLPKSLIRNQFRFFLIFRLFPTFRLSDSTTLNQTLPFKTTLFGKYIPIIFIPLKRRKYFMPCPFETIISSENKDKGEIFFNISFLRRLTHSALLGKGIRTPSGIPSHSLLRVIEKVQRDIVPSIKNINQTNLHRWANRTGKNCYLVLR